MFFMNLLLLAIFLFIVWAFFAAMADIRERNHQRTLEYMAVEQEHARELRKQAAQSDKAESADVLNAPEDDIWVQAYGVAAPRDMSLAQFKRFHEKRGRTAQDTLDALAG